MHVRKIRITNELTYIIIIILTYISIIQASLLSYSNETLAAYLYYFGILVRAFMIMKFFFDRSIRKSNIRNIILFFAIFLISYFAIGSFTFFDLFYFSVLYKNRLKYEKIVDIFLITMIAGFISVILLDYIGYFPKFSVSRFGTSIIRYSYGFSHPNVTGRFVLYICILWILKRRENIKLWDFAIITGAAYWVYVYPNSVTSALMIVSIAVGILISKTYTFIFKKELVNNQLIKWLSVIIVPLIFIVIFYIAINASQNSTSILNELSETFYSRFWGGMSAIQKYSINLFGNRISFVTAAQRYFGSFLNYFTVDCLYILLPLRYGILCTIYFMFQLYISIKQTIIKRDTYLFLTFMIFILYSIAENGLIVMYSSFVFILSNSYKVGAHSGKSNAYKKH